MLQHTGAAGLMIGRAAQGNPWIFREIAHYLDSGEVLAPPTAEEVHGVMTRHLAQLHRCYGEALGVRVARKHIGWYLQGRPEAATTRRQLVRVETAAEQFQLLHDYFNDQADGNRSAARKVGRRIAA